MIESVEAVQVEEIVVVARVVEEVDAVLVAQLRARLDQAG